MPAPGRSTDRPPLRPWHALGVAIWLVALLALTLIPSGRADGSNDVRARSGDDDTRAAQLQRGHAVYAFHCTTCHGATGQGFEEARSAFPDDHYHCIRCHAPANPPVMTQAEIDRTQSVFALGNAPGLADAEALAKFGSAAGLHAYVRATMPRWNPGSLDDDEFLDVTAYVLHLAGLLPDDVPALTPEGLAAVSLASAAE
jgi:mono/diheme cytochrome c family protein